MACHSSLGVHSRADWRWCLNQSAVHLARVLHPSLLQRHKHLLRGILLPSCSSFLVLCGLLPFPIASAPVSFLPEPCTSARPQPPQYHPGKRHLALHITLYLQGPPCSLGAASGLVLRGMLSCLLQHSLQQLFGVPCNGSVVLKPAAPHQWVTALLWYRWTDVPLIRKVLTGNCCVPQ